MRKIFLLAVILISLLYSAAYAAIPHLINYQGRLTDKDSKPLEGSYALTFRIYDAENAGSLLWEETHSGVVIQKGIFSVLLGSVTSLSIPFDKPYFLEIKVGNEVMSPRQRISSAGYAIRAEKAEDANTVANVGISTTPAPNKILPLDSAGKLPLSSLGLKVYDSGWFAAATGNSYAKTHSLGTTKLLISLFCADDTSGTNAFQVGYADVRSDGSEAMHTSVVKNITVTTFVVQAGSGSIAMNLNSIGTYAAKPSGYLRVIAIALE